jgi:hypothetical protein
MKRSIRVALGIILGLFLVGIAALYWLTPAGQLPTYVPGYEAGVTSTHFKHGLAALILGIFSLIYAWFGSASTETP